MNFALSPAIDSSGGLIYCWNCARINKKSRVFQRFVAIRGSWVVGDSLEGLI